MNIREITQKNIKRIRAKKKISQDDLQESTKIAKSSLSKIENQPTNLTLDVIEKIARGLNCEAYELLLTKPIAQEKTKKQKLKEAISLIRQVISEEK